MNILICDDMNEDSLRLRMIIEALRPNARIVIFNAGADVLESIDTGKMPCACFLDIIMPEMDGISLAERMREKGYKGHIVFLTNSKDYALESYKVKAFNYLLKPPEEKDVATVLAEIEAAIKLEDTAGLLIKNKLMSKFLLFKEISHIEVKGHKVYYRLTNGNEIEESARFTDILSRLQADRRFAQCHRSFVLNIDDVYKIQGNNAVMKSGKDFPGKKIPITRSYADFYDRYVEYLFGENKTGEKR